MSVVIVVKTFLLYLDVGRAVRYPVIQLRKTENRLTNRYNHSMIRLLNNTPRRARSSHFVF